MSKLKLDSVPYLGIIGVMLFINLLLAMESTNFLTFLLPSAFINIVALVAIGVVEKRTTEKVLMSLMVLLNFVVQAYVPEFATIGLWVFAALQLLLALEMFAKVKLLKLPEASKNATPMPLVFLTIYAVLLFISSADFNGKLWASSIIIIAIGMVAPSFVKKGGAAKLVKFLPLIGCLLSIYVSLSALIHL
jgi:hypothetical protein